MQKDRFIFAIIIYGLILLAGAGICSVLLPEDISAVANTGVEAGKHVASQPDEEVAPTQAVTPTKEPEQNVEDANNDKSENQNLSEQVKPEDKIPDEEGRADEIPDETKQEQEVADGPWAMLSAETTAAWREIIGERCIVLQKPEQDAPERELLFSLTEMPVEQSIALRVLGCKLTEYGYDAVERIAGEKYFVSEPLAPEEERSEDDTDGTEGEKTAEAVDRDKDPLRRMTQSCMQQEDGSYELYMELLLDKTYVYNVYETETHYFIALKEAKEVYDRVVVLDAGHGGWDTGTPSRDGKVLEKNINLQVLLYLEELLAAEDIKVYATRTTDRYIGHAERIALANALEADMFFSIHCNNAYQDAEANGAEVLYTQYCAAEGNLNSEKLAQLCQEELVDTLQLNDRGLQARGDDLTVLQKAEVPAVQVELAFMSNEEDMNALKKEETQRKVAEALYRAVMRAYDVMAAE